jgi:putative SOS response-associated peptidase YedK
MCGRIALYSTPERLSRQLQAALDAQVDPDAAPSWNVAPTDEALAIRAPRPPQDPDTRSGHEDQRTPQREITFFRWGLVPYWAKDASIGSRMINARAETVNSKPAFQPLLARRRCLVVADGFYEWKRTETHRKTSTPFYFERDDGDPLTFAGLWDIWRDPNRPDDPEGRLRTCTVITTAASPDVADIHDRMPVIVERDEIDQWLDRDKRDLGYAQSFLHPSPAGLLTRHRVSRRVNNVRNDGPDLIEEDESPEPTAASTPKERHSGDHSGDQPSGGEPQRLF